MKQFFLVVSISVLTIATINAQTKAKKPVVKPAATSIKAPPSGSLKTKVDSFSYALGMNVANNLRQQGITDISNLAMQKGIEDVFKKKALMLNEQQANMCIQLALQANMAKKNEAVKLQGAAFLEANKKKPGIIILPSGLQYEVIMKGDMNAPSPKLQDTVVMNYKGTLINGKQFDNSYEKGQPLTMKVSDFIIGWQEVLQLMHVGDKWKVYIPSELGYGERSMGNDIPGGSTLLFDMELISVKPASVAAENPKQ